MSRDDYEHINPFKFRIPPAGEEPRESDPRYFRRRGRWYTSQTGECVKCRHGHTGAVIEGDACCNPRGCDGRVGPTRGVAP